MTADTPTSDSHARAYDPDPGCGLCGGLGKRHIARGLTTARVDCPCTLIGPELRGRVDLNRYALGDDLSQYAAAFACDDHELLASYRRTTSELPPIKDTAVLDAYPDCQPRTPIDPVARILSPGLQRGNADLQPAMCKQKPVTRECPTCNGRGVMPRSPWAKEPGDVMCSPCKGAGRVPL